MPDARQNLEHELQAEAPPAVAALPDEQLQALAGALRAARMRQREALGEALDQGLSFVPRLLRGPLRKALGL